MTRAGILGTVLALTAGTASAQSPYEVAVGTFYYGSRPPITPGWTLSAAFDVDGHTYVVEGSWFSRSTVRLFDSWDPSQGQVASRAMAMFLTAGVRSPKSDAPIAPFYQVQMGGYHGRFRQDYVYPPEIDAAAENARCGSYVGDVKWSSCLNVPYPEYEETRRNWLLVQPSIGLDARIWRGIGFRARLDVLGLVNRDWGVEWAPRMSTQVVIGFGKQGTS